MALHLSRETYEWVKQFYAENAYSGNPSVQHKHNHIDCPAGEDTRERLYTRVTEDNSKILMHCFNCGGSGAIPLRQTVERLLLKDKQVVRTPDYEEWDRAVALYKYGVPIRASWWHDARGEIANGGVWPYKAILNQEELDLMTDKDWYGMRVNGEWFITPRGTTGFDFRNVDKKMSRIVHPLHKNDSKVLVYNSTNSDTAIICEDALSAMKCDLAGIGGVALCGSHLSTDDAFKLTMRFKRFLVWLDNDNDEVIANAKIARDRLMLYTDQVRLNLEDRDPKRYGLPSLLFEIQYRFEDQEEE